MSELEDQVQSMLEAAQRLVPDITAEVMALCQRRISAIAADDLNLIVAEDYAVVVVLRALGEHLTRTIPTPLHHTLGAHVREFVNELQGMVERDT